MSILDPQQAVQLDRLLSIIRDYQSCAVAFSGGIDSTVVAKAAQLAIGDKAVAVTGVSASLAAGELTEARNLAELIGIRHEVIATDEFNQRQYVNNAPDRCFHCKTELYTQIEGLADRLRVAVIANGANLDDRGDYRPGMQAAARHSVRSPLLECEMTKADVRALAAYWQLPTWDKPASPCLSSRVAYGEEVTPQRLAMIDRAEQYLRGLGFRIVRVRYHRGDLARIELPENELCRLAEVSLYAQIVAQFKALGFTFVTLNLEGFRSGSMNELLSLVQLPKGSVESPQNAKAQR